MTIDDTVFFALSNSSSPLIILLCAERRAMEVSYVDDEPIIMKLVDVLFF
ncbi:MAG: hypothetical protein K9J21_12715 [Bacteroidales bacterium]|nr:hypothetical protein [Bacteroidales bacterium]